MNTNLTQHQNASNLSDFLPGDFVVFISENSTDRSPVGKAWSGEIGWVAA